MMIRSLIHRQSRTNPFLQCILCSKIGHQTRFVDLIDGLSIGTDDQKRRSSSSHQPTHGHDNHKENRSDDTDDRSRSNQWNSNFHHSTQQQQSLDSMTKHVELDFFGEPVTFLHDSPKDGTSHTNIHKVRSNSMAAMDGFLLCVVSKGKTCTYGGSEGGLEIKSAHSSAIAWTEALINSMIWNYDKNNRDIEARDSKENTIIPFESTMIAPMLAVVSVAPILAQTGIAYVKHLDTLLLQCKSRVPGLPPVQMMDMAYNAIQYKDNTEQFNERECMHLQALYHLLHRQYPTALITYLKILRSCPGDALAMSLAMDLSLALGDKQAAFRYVSRNRTILEACIY